MLLGAEFLAMILVVVTSGVACFHVCGHDARYRLVELREGFLQYLRVGEALSAYFAS